MSAAFTCGHPRTPENAIRTGRRGSGHTSCRFCSRVRQMCLVVVRRQARINAGLPPSRHGPASAWL